MFEIIELIGFLILAELGLYVLFKSRGETIDLVVSIWLFSTAVWSLGQFFMITASSLNDLVFPMQLSLTGIFIMGSSTLHLALAYPKKRKILSKKGILHLIYLPAIVFPIFIITNSSHSLFLSQLQYNQNALLHYTLSYGAIGQIAKIFPYAFVSISLILFIQATLKNKGRVKKGSSFISLGLFIGLLSSILSEFTIIPATTLFPISGLLFTIAALKYQIILLTPTIAADNILKTMNDSLILTDIENNILRTNDSVAETTGYTEQDLRASNVASLFNKPKNFLTSQQFQELQQGKPIDNYIDELSSKKGILLTASINATPILDNENRINGYVYTIRDVSKEKKAEKKLMKSKQDLEQINHKLQKRTKEVETLLSQKDELIHLLAHDLKNPLTTPLSLLPIIEKKTEDEDVKKMVNVSLKSVSTIHRIIDETLQMARYEDSSKGLHLKKTSVTEMVKRVIENNDNLINQHHFSIETEIPDELQITVDEFQLEEVFTNLLSNAIKYTPEEHLGKIKIKATEKDDMILFSIEDNGIGLNDNQQKRVFEKFYKSAKPRKGMDSTGLGLGICKNIIEHHGGSIWAESPGIGKGSTFSFTIPNHPNKNETPQEKTTEESIEQSIDQLLKI